MPKNSPMLNSGLDFFLLFGRSTLDLMDNHWNNISSNKSFELICAKRKEDLLEEILFQWLSIKSKVLQK